MPVTFELFGTGTDEDITQTYSVYVRRDVDGLYLDADDDTFKAFAALVSGKHLMTENADVPGCWELEVSALDVGDTGQFTFLPHDDLTDYLVAASVESVYLVDGERLTPTDRGTAKLHTHYGGHENLKLLDENGAPIDGATIRVYSKADYDAGDVDTAIGITHTDHRGHWVDMIPVAVGTTYTVHYHKNGVIGPVSVEVVIP